MQKYLGTLSQVLHYIQRERGFTTLYLKSNEKLAENTLTSCFKKTDSKILNLYSCIDKWRKSSKLDDDHLEIINNITYNLEKLTKKRQLISALKIESYKSIDFYTNGIILPITQLMTSFAMLVRDSHPNAVSAYCFFLKWKEKVALERSVLIQVFSKDGLKDKDYLEKIGFLLNEQEYYKKSFLSLSTIEQQKLVKSTYKSPSVQKLHIIHNEIKAGIAPKLLLNMNAKTWFNFISIKLNILHSLEQKLIPSLDKEHSLFKESLPIKKVKNKLVYQLSIFKNMEVDAVSQIMKQGYTYQIPKNKTIILENNIITHLHFVLVGWVKVYTNNKNILQIIGSNDSILEDYVLSDRLFHANVKTVTDVLMFSLPLSVVKKQINLNNKFTKNLLQNIMSKSINKSQDMELIKTKSAVERVGSFLLKLNVEKKWLSNKIELPYNKSLIASNLGMSREALSRTISSLKKKGYVITKNSLIIPNENSLCQYCNHNIAKQCNDKNHKTINCQQ